MVDVTVSDKDENVDESAVAVSLVRNVTVATFPTELIVSQSLNNVKYAKHEMNNIVIPRKDNRFDIFEFAAILSKFRQSFF